MAAGQLIIEDRVAVPSTAFDHAGYRAWVTSADYPAGLRTAFVHGEVLIEMSPESIETHNQVKAAVTAALVAFARDRDLGVTYPAGALLTNEGAALSCEPDLTFVSWAGFESGRVQLRARTGTADEFIEIVGSPDLVVEIVSDSSVKKDTELLRDAYCRAGVREYWLIDARGTDIRFEILSNTGETFAGSRDPLAPQQSRVLACRCQLTRTRNRIGRFAYRLDIVH